jgi:hypothetical protein
MIATSATLHSTDEALTAVWSSALEWRKRSRAHLCRGAGVRLLPSGIWRVDGLGSGSPGMTVPSGGPCQSASRADVDADIALLVAALDASTNCGPERPRIREVSAEGVPGEARVLGAQRGQARSCQSASLILGRRVGLLHPTQPAATADLVVHGEGALAAQVGSALTPADALTRDGVLPRGGQLGNHRPSSRPAQSPTADPPQESTPGLPTGDAANPIGQLGELPRRRTIHALLRLGHRRRRPEVADRSADVDTHPAVHPPEQRGYRNSSTAGTGGDHPEHRAGVLGVNHRVCAILGPSAPPPSRPPATFKRAARCGTGRSPRRSLWRAR